MHHDSPEGCGADFSAAAFGVETIGITPHAPKTAFCGSGN
jgi:hypothetical protein